MNYRVLVLPEAERDLIRLGEFVGEVSPDLSDRVRNLLVKAMKSLERRPERGRRLPRREERQLLVPFGSVGYVIHYRLAGDEVTISRIFHTREDR